MTKLDPIIAVTNVEASSLWYQAVFGCTSMHGGKDFDILVAEDKEVLICLHKWGAQEHPTMTNPDITPGNGVILYFRTDRMNVIRRNVEVHGYPVEQDVHLNPNSLRNEFSLRDPDGYYLTITDHHQYEG